MTPDEALARAIEKVLPVVEDGITFKADYTAAEIAVEIAALGYSLVPTADLDRLRAAPLDVDRLADIITALHLRWAHYCAESHIPDAEWFASQYAPLGDRAAEEGR